MSGIATTGGALDAALARVGDRWSLRIVEVLLPGARRFNDLLRELPGLAPNILSQRLKHLEREGVIVARPYSTRPLRLSYQLTPDGSALASALRLLAAWGAAGSDHVERPMHDSCGTPMEAHWYCPTCARTVRDEDEEQTVRYL